MFGTFVLWRAIGVRLLDLLSVLKYALLPLHTLRAVDRDFVAVVVPVPTSFVLPPCGVEAFCGTWDRHFILVGLVMTC